MDVYTDKRHVAIVYESGRTCPLCDALDSIGDLTARLDEARNEIADLTQIDELYSRLGSNVE